MKKKLPIFTTTDDRAKYLAAYEAMFSLWKVPHDSIDIKTRYGTTHINVCGPKGGQPLVLLHGAGLSSTAWSIGCQVLKDTDIFPFTLPESP